MIKQYVLTEEEYDELLACKVMLERLEAPLEQVRLQSFGGTHDTEPTIFWRGMAIKLTLIPQQPVKEVRFANGSKVQVNARGKDPLKGADEPTII